RRALPIGSQAALQSASEARGQAARDIVPLQVVEEIESEAGLIQPAQQIAMLVWRSAVQGCERREVLARRDRGGHGGFQPGVTHYTPLRRLWRPGCERGRRRLRRGIR